MPVEAAKADHLDAFAEQSLSYLALRGAMATAITAVMLFSNMVTTGLIWGFMVLAAEFLWTSRSKRILARRHALTKLDYYTTVFVNLVLVIVYLTLSVFLVVEQSPLMVLAAVIWVAGGFFAAVLVLVPDRLLMATTYGPSVAAMVAVANLIDWSWRDGAVTPDAVLTFAISLFFAMFIVRAFLMAGEFQRRAYADKQALELRRAAAERASVNKTAFLARMSHEIRTPLNGVLGCASLLSETRLEPRQRHLAEQIIHSGDTLLSVLNDVLDISKIEVGGLDLDTGPIEIERMFNDCVNLMMPEAEHNNVVMRAHVDNRLPQEILGDAPRLRQIMLNLLSNAIKFNEAGEVMAGVWLGNPRADGSPELRIEITEAGAGMAPLMRYGPYNPFADGQDDRKKFEKSAGLGLIISRDLAEQMGGVMTLEEMDGGGFCLAVGLPLVAAPGSPQIGAAWRAALSGHKLLLLSEDALCCDWAIESLTAIGLEVVRVTNAAEARGAAAAASSSGRVFDFACLSHSLLGDEVLEVVQSLRRESAFRATSFVLDCGAPPPDHIKNSTLLDAVVIHGVLPKGLPAVLDQIKRRNMPFSQVAGPDTDIPDLSGRRVILAEDDITNRMLLQALLEPTGAKVAVANDGHEVLRLIDEEPTDLVFMDIRMPRMDGIEAARQIRALNAEKTRQQGDVRIIAVTANAKEEDKALYLSAGMDDYLAKPVLVDDIYDLLRTHLLEPAARSA